MPTPLSTSSSPGQAPAPLARWVSLGLLLVAAATSPAFAQPKSTLPEITVRGGFKAPITEANRRVALVSGQEAKPALLAGQLAVTGFRLETYRYNPDQQVDLVVESPTALFDSKGAASSAGTLTLRGPNNRFTVSGEGWSWDQKGGLLVISNRVRTLLRPTGANSNQPPVEITAQRLDYNLKTGDTRFRQDCVANQPGRARISAGELSSRLGADVERPDAIRAQDHVVIELLRPGHQARATGDHAEYQSTPQGEAIELTGHPTWQFANGSGSADQLKLYPDREAYQARGNARLRLLGNPPKPDLVPAPNASANPAAKTNSVGPKLRRPVDIACDSIEARPGEVVFAGGVSAVQSNALALKADRLVAEFAPGTTAAPDSLHLITATGNVTSQIALGQRSVELQGGRMTYTVGEHPRIEVTENPTWRSEGNRGQGKRFVILPDQTAFQVLEEVQVEWTSLSGPTNATPIRLNAGLLRFEGSDAHFTEGVTVTQPDWQLRGAELDLRLTTNSQLQALQVRKNVELDFTARVSSTNAPAANPGGRAAHPARGSAGANHRWKVRADDVEAQLEPGRDTIMALDASGRVEIENPSVRAGGGQLKYRAADGIMRLSKDAELITTDGLVIIGEHDTAIGFEPETGRRRVEGPVRRMTFPAKTARPTTPKH
jgi:lipopolysaccharide export system protein LptA